MLAGSLLDYGADYVLSFIESLKRTEAFKHASEYSRLIRETNEILHEFSFSSTITPIEELTRKVESNKTNS